MSSVAEATHPDPAWRERANFIIATDIDAATTNLRTEQLWARQITDFQFEICCIPFFAYNLSLGDVVETDGTYLVKSVLKHSGRYVFRVWLGSSFLPREDLVHDVGLRGGILEWSSVNMVAIDIEGETAAQALAGFLQEQEDCNNLVYETGRQ